MTFYKYHGTGNDFIIIDNRGKIFDPDNHKLIKSLCDRRFGIGADGLMLLTNHNKLDFELTYFNSDGFQGSLCGNGARCMVAFARRLGLIDDRTKFQAYDGMHEGLIMKDLIRIRMNSVQRIEKQDNTFLLDTGSPHVVLFRKDINEMDVYKEGRTIRFGKRFREEGINVNFVGEKGDELFVRTYERGVENETLSCGTGVIASAISAAFKNLHDNNTFTVATKGGKLRVYFKRISETLFDDIWLEGPASFVFEGQITI